ncbi:Eco57I restriction-modification methylase domain-containing protein [uncultured Mobiluncus sp.]|uniref:Eco57I restriction-modification methylase domain-containing protein n=1 Tax=uncultured Mobiluncus sp. TaxID=293425 RepID=UPI0026287C31|nr:DNA methyltransferase [uncultured Mobiluncus sp.]
MTGFSRLNKESARKRMAQLVARYSPLHDNLTSSKSGFTETETRTQYIDEFLKILGWDVSNEAGATNRKADVVQEHSHTTEDSGRGRPDYILRVSGKDKLPVEAKKTSYSFAGDKAAPSQVRAYGWTLNTPIGVLTNFTETRIYSTLSEPTDDQPSEFGLIPGGVWRFDEYNARFDDLWERLSYESVSSKQFELLYGDTRQFKGESEFDESFLNAFRKWRKELAQEIYNANSMLPEKEIGRRTQKVLNALLFMRVCEDKDILSYKDLLTSATSSNILATFRDRDKVFNAGIFKALEDINLPDSALLPVIKQMYWPNSKFAYGLLRPDTLAYIYEQYLSEHVVIDSSGLVRLEEKPEVLHAGGIARTPDYIMQRLTIPSIDKQLAAGVSTPTILDMSVGSGGFLLTAFEHLIELKEREIGRPLEIAERAHIAQTQLFGIDIDGAAVEVTRLSLLLAILGNSDVDTTTDTAVLPDLGQNIIIGNAVVRQDFDRIAPKWAANIDARLSALPLNLEKALGTLFPTQGFNIIIGNPPYVRIQVLSEFFPAQLDYFQSPKSGYVSASSGNFDLYMIFIERALTLLNDSGSLALILPNRFFSTDSATGLRKKLSQRIHRLVDFGVEQVFEGKTTYTALIYVGEKTSTPVEVDLVSNLSEWVLDEKAVTSARIDRKSLESEAWNILTPAQSALFSQMFKESDTSLGDEAEVFVGVQTSADEIFMIKDPKPVGNAPGLVSFQDLNGVPQMIECSILRPAIKDVRIAVLDSEPTPDRWAIFPYAIEETEAGRLVSHVYSLDELQRNYPYALNYFTQHREELTKRSITPDPKGKYWSYGRSQSLTKLDEPKLVVRVLSIRPSYAYDSKGLVTPGGGDGGPYYLIRPLEKSKFSIELLQAILSHPAVDHYVTSIGKKYRGEYAVHRKAYLIKVPLPNVNTQDTQRIEEMVFECRGLSLQIRDETDSQRRTVAEGRKQYLHNEINTLISAAYKITKELLSDARLSNS